MMEQALPRFELATAYDETAYSVLVALMMKRLRRWPRYAVTATGLVSVLYSGYAILSTGRLSPIALLFLFLGNAFTVLGLLAPRLAVRLMLAHNGKNNPPVNGYALFDDHLTITTQDGPRDYSYGFLHRVLDTQGYYVLFMRDGQAYLLRHADMAPGRREALHHFLNDRLAESRREAPCAMASRSA